MGINIGDPVILKNSSGLKKYGLTKNMPGYCNSLVEVEGDGSYLMFQPEGANKFYWVQADRFVLDEEKLNGQS